MDELIKSLAENREMSSAAKDKMNRVLEAAKEGFDYQFAQKAKATADAEIARLETEIKEKALVLFDGENKQIHPSVSIAVTKKFDIVDNIALMAWCVKNYAAAVVTKVDESLVKELALFNAKKNHAQIDGVSVSDVPQVRISANL